MKRIIVALAILGVALVALGVGGGGPTLTARARQKCLEMLEGTSGSCPPPRATASTEASCSGPTPARL